MQGGRGRVRRDPRPRGMRAEPDHTAREGAVRLPGGNGALLLD